mmetsp:Transcript_27042/g.49730  ORF Transcript_27042/g.49730 Transcript_27042/m.49730 type:complete len:82 (+) Transcript_27042:122-367(+)
MLDLITLVSTMGLQEELSKATKDGKESRVIKPEDSEDESLIQQAANSLGSAFESFESAVSGGVVALFGSVSSSAAPVAKKA